MASRVVHGVTAQDAVEKARAFVQTLPENIRSTATLSSAQPADASATSEGVPAGQQYTRDWVVTVTYQGGSGGFLGDIADISKFRLQGALSQFPSGPPQVGQGRAGDYNKLVGQMTNMVAGAGIAGVDQYRQAMERARNSQRALAHNMTSAQGSYGAQQGLASLRQGQAQGEDVARLQGQLGALGAMGGILGAADQSGFDRAHANQQAQLSILEQLTGLTAAELQAEAAKYGIDMGQPGAVDRYLAAAGAGLATWGALKNKD